MQYITWVNFIRSDSDLGYFSGSDPDQFQLNPDPNSAYKLVGYVLGGIWMGGLPWLALVYCDLARARTLVHALRSKHRNKSSLSLVLRHRSIEHRIVIDG